MTTFHSDEDDEIVSELEEDVLELTREEVTAILIECRYSYISYYNPVAVQAIRKMAKFVDNT